MADVIDAGGGILVEVADPPPAKPVKAKKKSKKKKPTAKSGGGLRKLFPVTTEDTRGGGTRNVIGGFTQAEFLRGCGAIGLRATPVRDQILKKGLGLDVPMNSIVSMVSGGSLMKANDPDRPSHHPGPVAKFTREQRDALKAACKPAEKA